jgi:hypothetical protein
MTSLQDLPLRDLFILASLKGQSEKEHLFDERARIGQNQFNVSWIEEKIKEGVDKSIPLNRDQIKEAIQLVKTGEITDDIRTSLLGILRNATNVPSELLNNPTSIFYSPLHAISLPITTVRDTAKIFIDPNNHTFRLAILAYARMNGINITERNLNDLYNLLDNPNSDNLEELAKGGLETIKEEYGLNDLNEALQKFKSLTGQ